MDNLEKKNAEIRMIEDEKNRIYAQSTYGDLENQVSKNILDQYEVVTPKTIDDYWGQYLDKWGSYLD
jgi:hypothetical protein